MDPVSAQHILNVTSLAFAVGMLFFFYLGVWKHQGKRLLPVFVFFASVIGAISYYAELCGVGTHAAAGGHLLLYSLSWRWSRLSASCRIRQRLSSSRCCAPCC